MITKQPLQVKKQTSLRGEVSHPTVIGVAYRPHWPKGDIRMSIAAEITGRVWPLGKESVRSMTMPPPVHADFGTGFK